MSASPDRPTTASTDSADRASSGLLGLLRGATLATAIAVVLQLLIGGYLFTANNATLVSAHNIIGLLAIVAGIVATVAAFLNKSRGGNPGLAFHILGTTVLLLVQYALGEVGSGLIITHMVIGIVILVSAIAMATLAFRKPFARR